MIKNRILTGWTFTRAAYTAVGLYITFQTFADKQWAFLPLGLYFASMGIFAFGCASGNCYVPKSTSIKDDGSSFTYEELNKQ